MVATPQPLTLPAPFVQGRAIPWPRETEPSQYDGGRSRLVAFPLLVQSVEFVGHGVPDAHIAHTAG